jgi:hypothetical protein
VSQRLLIIKPGPKRLCAALRLAGFSPAVILPPITDACGVRWDKPSELQVAGAVAGGESSDSAGAFHVNADGSTDFGEMEINDKAHSGMFTPQTIPDGFNWLDWIDNARAAFQVYVDAQRKFTPWRAYTGGGYASERWQGRSWLDWSSFGISQMTPAVAALVRQGKTQAAALASVASIDLDPLIYS